MYRQPYGFLYVFYWLPSQLRSHTHSCTQTHNLFFIHMCLFDLLGRQSHPHNYLFFIHICFFDVLGRQSHPLSFTLVLLFPQYLYSRRHEFPTMLSISCQISLLFLLSVFSAAHFHHFTL